MDTNAQILLSPYLRSMVMACLLDSEANHIRAGRPDMTPEEWKEYVEKKHLARSECLEALCADPRYTAARLMLALSLGDIGASRRWFATCQDFCCDNLGMLTQGAYNLTSRWGGSTELIEDFLDRALESNRYDTFLPAYYVLGRWQVLAKYEKSFDVCDADERGWAYTDPEVRRKTLEVIRKYKDSDTLARTHGQNRNVFLAVFAAVALTCEDEPLAKELVLRLPKADFYCIIDQAAREGTRMFSKLSRLYRGLNATPPLISKTRATGKGPLLQTLNLPRSYRLTLLIKAHHENGVPGWPEFAFMLGRPIRCANPNVAAGVYVGNWADTWRVNPIKEKGFRPTEIADSWFYDVSEIPFLHNNPSILTDADGKGPLEVIIELQNDLLTIYVAGEKIVDHFDVAKETDRYEGGEQLTSREQFLWLERMEIVSATLSE